jgi:hypothetical protein
MVPLQLCLDADQLDRQIQDIRSILRLPRLSRRARADLGHLIVLLTTLRRALLTEGG